MDRTRSSSSSDSTKLKREGLNKSNLQSRSRSHRSHNQEFIHITKDSVPMNKNQIDRQETLNILESINRIPIQSLKDFKQSHDARYNHNVYEAADKILTFKTVISNREAATLQEDAIKAYKDYESHFSKLRS